MRRNRRASIGCSALAVLALCGSPHIAPAQEAAPSVRLIIDYGDGVQKTFQRIEWKEKLTVFAALQAAAKHPRGIKLEHSGSGESLFIKAIDDCENEGQGGRNWRYLVGGESGRVSAGIAEVKAGDEIMWHFAR
jgi:hypothetical protein